MQSSPSRITIKDNHSMINTKRVLLLEDDEMFKTIIKEFLESNFYEVIAVNNGAEGVRAVLKQEFDVVICDMMMPKLPGDMFYTAIERMRPHLCRRFIFITGHRGNPKINDFIKQVRGTMLAKPFHMDDLLEAIAFVQVKTAIR
ncbi:MAG TPA: response regulator [Chthoniobacteraceae bacterium]|jgi:DNA-binding NtrC family response regulator|nr:response regulator [Chthoniobacteraceae bacterium]